MIPEEKTRICTEPHRKPGKKHVWMLTFLLPSLLMGRVLKFPFTTHRRCKCVDLYSKNIRLNVYGEILNLDEAHFSILQGALSLFW